MPDPRLPDYVRIVDAESRQRAYGQRFRIPNRTAREGLEVGALAKLIFELMPRGGGSPEGERLWVEVLEVRGTFPRYLGRIDNAPIVMPELDYDSKVVFGPEHVTDIHGEDW